MYETSEISRTCVLNANYIYLLLGGVQPQKTQTQNGISNYFWVFWVFWGFFRKRCGKYLSQHF